MCSHVRRSKAVADGAISYYLDHWVNARVAKYSIGVLFEEEFDSRNSDHINDPAKKALVHEGATGTKFIGPKFECYISKVSL